MATVDTSIYAPFLRGVKSVAEFDQEARRGEAADLDLANARDTRAANARSLQRQQGLENLLRTMRPGASDLERVAALKGGGYFNEADSLAAGLAKREKDVADAEKTRADTGKAQGDTRAKAFETSQKAWRDNVGFLQSVKSPDEVRSYLVGLVERAPPELQEEHIGRARNMIQSIPTDPKGFDAWRTQQLQGVLDAGEALKFKMPDANAVLGSQTTRRGQDISAATARRGQDLTAATAREGNAIAKDLANRQKALTIDEMEGKAADRASAKDAALQAIDNQIGIVQKALEHPGRTISTGGSSILNLDKVPGTDAANFSAVLNQIKGGAFLQGFQAMKGAGAITEIEGKKAEQSIARLETAQSDDAFEEALVELQGILQDGKKRMQGMKQQRGGAAPAGRPMAPPTTGSTALDAALQQYLK